MTIFRQPAKYKKYNKLWIGVVVGLCLPVAAYGILLSLSDFLENSGMLGSFHFSSSFESRTLTIIALCFNIIPMRWSNKYYLLNAMRGIVFPTVLYAGWWVIKFAGTLL